MNAPSASFPLFKYECSKWESAHRSRYNKTPHAPLEATMRKDNDKYIVQALRLFQVICRYLGIKSTTTANSFDSSKLDNDIFWSPISEKLLIIFGENRIALINEHERDWLVKPNITRQLQQQEITRSQTFILLNIVFNGWSGSILTIEKNNSNIINIIPATYITRMMMKLI